MPETIPAAFISYSRDDQEFALRLAQDLKAAGAAVWLDQLDIEPGAPWDNAVEDALIASPRMLLILSPHSSRSANVRNEISFALEQGKIVIPVLYRDCIVPLQLQRNNRIDFRADYARGLALLLAHLQVTHPDQAVLQRAAEDDARRDAAWKAREAEAARLRDVEEQEKTREVEKARAAQEEKLRREQEAEARRRQAAEQQQKADAAERLATEAQQRRQLEQQQKAKAEADRWAAEAEVQRARDREQQKKADAERLAAAAEAQRRRQVEQQQKASAERRAAPPPAPGPPPPPQRPPAPASIPWQRSSAVTPPSPAKPLTTRAPIPRLWLWLGGGAAAIVLLLVVLFIIGISSGPSKDPGPPAPGPDHPDSIPVSAPTDVLPTPDAATAAAAKAQVDKGLDLIKSKHYAQAVPLLSAACDAGNPDGCIDLGYMYQQHLGVAQDYPKAIALYTRVCDSANASGCNLLARIDHEVLFDFDAALVANQKTLKLNPTVGNSMDVMEAQLTAGHYDDCIQLAATLNAPALTAAQVVVRDSIKLACQSGADRESDVLATAKLLQQEAKDTKSNTWDFTGTLHFLETSPNFATGRSAWISLFTAVQNGNAANIRTALSALALAAIGSPGEQSPAT